MTVNDLIILLWPLFAVALAGGAAWFFVKYT